jgi:molybdopterin molybdotransferase
VRLSVVDDARVTAAAPVRLTPGTAVLVATGAPLPRGADAVVPVERTDGGGAQVVVTGGVVRGEQVRAAGDDAAAGELVLCRGVSLGARHLAVAAAVGRSRLWVHPAPRVVVITVGEELVEPGRQLREGSVPDADGHALVAAARDAGARVVRVGPVGDDRAALREVLTDQLVRADLLLLTGGLSPGPWDTVPDVLAPMGVRFEAVAMSPGGRQGFGTVSPGADPGEGDVSGEGDATGEDEGVATERVLVFALPGHPVAALVSFEVFVRPVLRAMGGYAEWFRPTVPARAASSWQAAAGLCQVVPATVTGTPSQGYSVTPLGDPGRASLAALAQANALALVAEEITEVTASDTVTCLLLEG